MIPRSAISACPQRVATALLSMLSLTAVSLAAGLPRSPALSWQAVYTAEQWAHVQDGDVRGNRYLDNLDLLMDIDGEPWGFPSLKIHGHLLYNNGGSISEIVGDRQNVSNIDAPEAVRLYELWFEHELNGAATIRVGIYDLNSEFDVIDRAGLFLNGSHGIGPDFSQSGPNGPSIFPITSLAVRGNWSPAPGWQIRGVVLDAVPGDPADPTRTSYDLSEGALAVIETGYASSNRRSRGTLGHWHYSNPKNAVVGNGTTVRERNYGSYASFETDLWQYEETSDRILGAFIRYGMAKANINELSSYLGLGLVIEAPFDGREDDVLGIALARAEASSLYRRFGTPPPAAFEASIELTYSIAISDWLRLQPDVQYVINPGLSVKNKDSWAVGLRAEISWGPQ